LKSFEQLKQITSKDLLFKNFFQTSTVIMKRRVFDAVGYFEKRSRTRGATLFFAGIKDIPVHAYE
jgi:hypothetical protein